MNYVTGTEIKSEATKKIENTFQVSDQTLAKEEFTSQLNESKDNKYLNPNVTSIEQSDQIDQQKSLDVEKEKMTEQNLKSTISDSQQNISQLTRVSLESTFETQNISNQQAFQQSSAYVDENKEEIKGSKLWKKFKNI